MMAEALGQGTCSQKVKKVTELLKMKKIENRSGTSRDGDATRRSSRGVDNATCSWNDEKNTS